MVGRDTPEPIRSGRPCKTSHGAGCGQRTENPPALAVGSVNRMWIKDKVNDCYGFEISAEYCDIAEKRIASVGKDIPLFEAD